MKTLVEIVSPGALATVQDLGRPGWRRFGVPRAGALNAAWLRIANALAGNAEEAPGIEFFLAGPTLKALDAPLRVACAGDFTLTLMRSGERSVLASWRSLTLLPGDTLRLGPPRHGRVGYLALAGLTLPPVLGSASTFVRAGFGGLDGRALAGGDRLEVTAAGAGDGRRPQERLLREPPAPDDAPIRVTPGPQDDCFSAAALAGFLAAQYRVTSEADRMGMRLDGPRIAHRPEQGAEIVSDATVPGSVQVPGNGLPIVLLADGQTAGGYPKIATVVSADLARLATAEVGGAVRFRAVSVAEAEQAARAHEARTRQRIASIGPLSLAGGIDLDAIRRANLVSGMVDALAPAPGEHSP